MCILALAVVTAVVAETTVAPGDDSTGLMTTEPPPITEFSLDIHHMQSTTSSIQFRWDAAVPEWMKVSSFSITVAKIGSEVDSLMTYPEVPGREDYFEAEDLIKDAEWTVCVTSKVLNGTSNPQEVEFKDCFDSFTIPYIRPDSVYVLFLVFGYIILMILVGYISWKCAVSRKEKAQAEAEAAAAAEDEEEDKKAN